jgi:tRNA pseudouridine38-40 synthase
VRYKLTLEYDGGPYSGWQRLEGASVQGALEDAVEKLTGARLDVIGSGRTDSGVHAAGQVAHVDIDKSFPSPQRLADALNAHLRPHPISVLSAEEATPDFHARFDAVRRVYQYRIVNRRAPLALERGKAWRVGPALNVAVMNEAAQRLVGHHDFTTFRDAHCQAKSPIKTLDRCEVWTDANIIVHCEARSFLHRQVRSIVGTLVEVGLGKMTAENVAEALAAKDRACCGPVAPADGLYLMRVDYAK